MVRFPAKQDNRFYDQVGGKGKDFGCNILTGLFPKRLNFVIDLTQLGFKIQEIFFTCLFFCLTKQIDVKQLNILTSLEKS